MSPLIGRLAPLLVALSPLACGYPTVNLFPFDELPPATAVATTGAKSGARPVRLYLDDAPRCAYTPLARVTVTPYAEGEVLWTEWVANTLRTRARAIGADAVVGLRQVTEDGGARLVTSGQRERTRDSTRSRATVAETTAVQHAQREWLEGTAVRFKDEGCRE